MAVAITINDTIQVFNAIPSTFNNTLNYNSINNEAQQIADGWRDVVQPSYNTETQRKGVIFFDTPNDVYTYEVIDLTDEQIQANIVAQSESEKQQLIQQKLEQQVVAQAQDLDDTESLDNQVLFPFWAPDQVYTLNQKCQFIVGLEIWLFKINQPTLTTSALNPPPTDGSSNALYTRVAFPDQILAWQAPTGAQDAYGVGIKVYYPNVGDQIWISKIPANTTVPDGDVPFNRYWEPFNG